MKEKYKHTGKNGEQIALSGCFKRFIFKCVFSACENEAVGVAEGVKAIPDGQMSGHYAYGSSDHSADEGRLDSSTGWIGEDSSSWLQVCVKQR